MHDFLYLDPEIKLSEAALLTIAVPKFDISRTVKMPENCRKIILTFNIIAINFNKQANTEVANIELEAEVNIQHSKVKAQSWEVDCSQHRNQIVFIGLHINYLSYQGKYIQLLNSKDFHPAAIVAAYCV